MQIDKVLNDKGPFNSQALFFQFQFYYIVRIARLYIFQIEAFLSWGNHLLWKLLYLTSTMLIARILLQVLYDLALSGLK